MQMYRTMHLWHWISAAVCFAALILFTVTGITLNHASAIGSTPEVQTGAARAPAPVLAAVAPADQGWSALKTVVMEALDLPAGTRKSHLEARCPDPGQRTEAARLLRACEEAARSPILDLPATQFAAPVVAEVDEGEREIPPGLRRALAGLYTVERELGRGGMATVYLARDERHGRSVALKLLRPGLLPGDGQITVNGKPMDVYITSLVQRVRIQDPLRITGVSASYNVEANVHGGGPSGQAGALRLGIARALLGIDPEFRSPLKKAGLLTRDPRVKERKKYGLRKARKRPQYSKR